MEIFVALASVIFTFLLIQSLFWFLVVPFFIFSMYNNIKIITEILKKEYGWNHPKDEKVGYTRME